MTPELPFERSYWVRPGQLLAGGYPGDRNGAQTTAKLSGLLRCGVTHVVNLMEPDELEWLGPFWSDSLPELEQLAAAQGRTVQWVRRPIPDMGVPMPEDLCATLDWIDAALAAGGVVYVHCLAGQGRTGLVIGCYLVRHGLTGPAALPPLQELTRSKAHLFWPTPQVLAQRAFVLNWPVGQ